MSNITVISRLSKYSDGSDYGSDYASNDGSDYGSNDGSNDGSNNGSEIFSPINNDSLAIKIGRIRNKQGFSICLAPHSNFLNSVLTGELTYNEMAHLASSSFVIYLSSSDPKLAKFVKQIMWSILKCNECGITWYKYEDYDVHSYYSIFLESSSILPPYVENIGSLHLVYFYPRWLKYYTIGSRLPFLMFNAIISKRQKHQREIEQFCKKQVIVKSFKSALCNTNLEETKQSSILQFFKLPKERGVCNIVSLLGYDIVL